jgi:hypothetical protein
MNTLGISALVILAAVSLLWTALLLPVLFELRRASWRLQEFIRSVELELRPFMQEARETLKSIDRAARDVGEGATHFRGAFSALEEAGKNVRDATGVFRSVFGSRFIPVASVLAGVRAGVKFLWRRSAKRREKS